MTPGDPTYIYRMTNIFIQDNVLFFTTRPSADHLHGGIAVENTDGITISGNQITNGSAVLQSDSTKAAISLIGSVATSTITDAVIQNNYIAGWSPGIRVWADSVAGALLIQRNVVYTEERPLNFYSSTALQVFPATAVVTVDHNTLVASSTYDAAVIDSFVSGSGTTVGSSLLMQNNILGNSSGGVGPPYTYFNMTGMFSGAVTIDYNLYWGISSTLRRFIVAAGNQTWAQWQALGYDTHSIGPNTDPELASVAGQDFHLLGSSPCIFAASDGTDIGAYPDLAPPPSASFIASPTTGLAPLMVQFADASTGSPSSWSWSFGDGGTSSLSNPTHQYAAVGAYTVSLAVANSAGSSTVTKAGYITILSPLSLILSADKPGALPGDTVTYTVAYRNMGQLPLANVQLVEQLPAGTTYVPGSASSSGVCDGRQVAWNLGALAAGASGTVTFSVTMN